MIISSKNQLNISQFQGKNWLLIQPQEQSIVFFLGIQLHCITSLRKCWYLKNMCYELFHPLIPKGLFTRYDFVACDKLMTGLQHELFHVNQTYNSLTTLKSCRRSVVSLSHATKSCRVNRP